MLAPMSASVLEPRQVEKASILIVEDDPQQLRLYAKALRGYRLTCVSSGTDALRPVRTGDKGSLAGLHERLASNHGPHCKTVADGLRENSQIRIDAVKPMRSAQAVPPTD